MTDSPAPGIPESGRHFAFAGNRLLTIVRPDGTHRLPRGPELGRVLAVALPGIEEVRPAELEIPSIQGERSFAYDLPEELDAPDGWALRTLRGLHDSLGPDLFRAAGVASQKLLWLRTHGFCSRCGAATRRHARHQAMECRDCGHLHFPRIAPAVIVLVTRGPEMLLARSPHFPEGMYSTLAGFVEPGETLEETVHREIREEVGVDVGRLRYFGSQPWPFPHSLMVGFTARWKAGEVVVDGEEIEAAGWFSADRLPPRLPGRVSIARRLVEAFLVQADPLP